MNDRAIDLSSSLSLPFSMFAPTAPLADEVYRQAALPVVVTQGGRNALAGRHDEQSPSASLAVEDSLFARPEQMLYLEEAIRHDRPGQSPARVWSINGERAAIYSAALLLAEAIGHGGWELIASDNRAEQLQAIRSSTFHLSACRHAPIHLLAKYCRISRLFDGGLVSLQRRLCDHIYVVHTVLGELLPMFGRFDAILLGPTALPRSQLNLRLPALAGMLRLGGCLLWQGQDEDGLVLPASLDRIGKHIYQRFE